MAVNKGTGFEDGAEPTDKEVKASPDVEKAIDAAHAGEDGFESDEELATESGYPYSVPVGSGEYHLTHVVKEAKKDSGLTAKKWNELGADERRVYIDKTLDRLRGEADADLNKARAEQSVAGDFVQEDVRVHESRGVGGRFVALGGGERIRIAEASGTPDAPILSDDEVAAMAENNG
jgi:hypothetical protein